MAEKVIPTPPYWSLAGQLLSGVSLDLANASVASTHPIQPRGVNEPLMFGRTSLVIIDATPGRKQGGPFIALMA